MNIANKLCRSNKLSAMNDDDIVDNIDEQQQSESSFVKIFVSSDSNSFEEQFVQSFD
jgi:hypothetical protein